MRGKEIIRRIVSNLCNNLKYLEGTKCNLGFCSGELECVETVLSQAVSY